MDNDIPITIPYPSAPTKWVQVGEVRIVLGLGSDRRQLLSAVEAAVSLLQGEREGLPAVDPTSAFSASVNDIDGTERHPTCPRCGQEAPLMRPHYCEVRL